MFTLVNRDSDQRSVVPAKPADESTVRLLNGDHDEESLPVYTDEFRVYNPLKDYENYERDTVIYGEGEYVDGDAHVNILGNHSSPA